MAEVERFRTVLLAAGGDLPLTRARQEGLREGRLRDLLAEDPPAAASLRGLLAKIRRQGLRAPRVVQAIKASASGAMAQGAIFGSIVNYGQPQEASGVETSGPPSAEYGHGGRS